MRENEVLVTILWHATPYRGDKFEDAWTPAAAAALDYGASSWALMRSKDDPLDFMQIASFPDKKAFERYWYSEEISEYRAEAHGWYEVPILPVWFRVVGAGQVAGVEVES
jgi:quinol monooxygenase YgiN